MCIRDSCHLVLVGDFDVEDIYTFVKEKQSEFTLPERMVEKEKNPIESDIQKLDSCLLYTSQLRRKLLKKASENLFQQAF